MSATVVAEQVAVPGRSALPRAALRVDAVTAGPFGLLLLVGARPIGEFLGWNEPLGLAAIGGFVIAYAGLLLRFASRDRIERRHLLVPILLNGAWVVGSALVLISGWRDLTVGGRWAVAIVADLVALIALAQVVALRRLP